MFGTSYIAGYEPINNARLQEVTPADQSALEAVENGRFVARH
jgi:hypothetical protein